MDPKKLNSQEAFDLVTRRQGKEMPDPNEPVDVEADFGEKSGFNIKERPIWLRFIFWGTVSMVTIGLIAAVTAFFWFVANHAEPELVEKSPPEAAPAIFTEEEVKRIVEVNLRAFLKAASNDERLKYIYQPEDEKSYLDVYYGKREHVDTHLWKIERLEPVTSAQGEIWFVVYRDVTKKQRLVSFQRYEDDYLLHWSAMTAYCELPWEQFIVKRPEEAVMMRGYVSHYEGPRPLGLSSDKFHCFLIEDREGLFSELAIMESGSVGFSVLTNLPKDGRHPVTLQLGYRPNPGANHDKILSIFALTNMRWQKLNMDPYLQ